MSNFKKIATLTMAMVSVTGAKANNLTELDTTEDQDTIRLYQIDEVIITSNAKETNQYSRFPGSISLISPQAITQQQITSMRDLSSLVPNLHIPEYGSRMSSAIYLRGVGNRSTGESVGLYVDNVPYLEKSAFDFELTDIAHIEVLRGPQGTLYGRNAMGGIINIHTLNPFDYQGQRASISYGKYNQINAKLSSYNKFSEKFAMTFGGYYNSHDGFFVNQFDNKKIDPEKNGGAHIRLEYRPKENLRMSLRSSFDILDQGAFPYGIVGEDGIVADPNLNDESNYKRNVYNVSYALNYANDYFTLNATTGFQHLDDHMMMDQDYSPASIFTINQKQKQNSVSQELTLKGNRGGSYQWTSGFFGFYKDFFTDTPIDFGVDGVRTMIQSGLDKIPAQVGTIKVKNETLHLGNSFEMPSFGLALYHESTYNNLFTRGLSITAGIRADFEKQYLTFDGDGEMTVDFKSAIPMMPGGEFVSRPVLHEDIHQHFWQISPKVALKYEFNANTHTYISVAKGYKTGGYNIQMSADILQKELQNDLMTKIMPMIPAPERNTMEKTSAFKPEHSWNYELGFRSELIENYLRMEANLFLMDIKDLQMTKFVPSGDGRMVVNAGEARSYGAEVSMTAKFMKQLTLNVNYGYTNAAFTKYDKEVKVAADEGGKEETITISYKGKQVPFTPMHTFNASLNYNRLLNGYWLDQCYMTLSVNGNGKIYWDEENSVSQNFYATLNGKIGVRKGIVNMGLWAKNMTNTNYNVFYFESFGNKLAQRGNPFQLGGEVSITF